jgi:hypothetical protein
VTRDYESLTVVEYDCLLVREKAGRAVAPGAVRS